jgi:hypothetical protein
MEWEKIKRRKKKKKMIMETILIINNSIYTRCNKCNQDRDKKIEFTTF